MAFNTPIRDHKYLVMPFTLTNAPSVIQALINDILWDMLNYYVFVYSHDIFIFSRSHHEHMHHVRTVLQCLLNNSLFIKPEKSEFHVSKVSFLSFILEEGSLQMDPRKTEAFSE